MSTIIPSPTFFFFFLNDPPPPDIYPLPHHAPLPISSRPPLRGGRSRGVGGLAGITPLDFFPTFRAFAALYIKTGPPCLAPDLGLILVPPVPAPHGTAAT